MRGEVIEPYLFQRQPGTTALPTAGQADVAGRKQPIERQQIALVQSGQVAVAVQGSRERQKTIAVQFARLQRRRLRDQEDGKQRAKETALSLEQGQFGQRQRPEEETVQIEETEQGRRSAQSVALQAVV